MTSHDRQPSAEELQKGVEQKRQQVGDTLNEILMRFQPQQLMEQLRGSVRDGVREAASGGAEQLMGVAREKAEEARAGLLDAVRSTPLAATLMELGLGWLLRQGTTRVRSQAEGTVRHAQDSLHQVATNAQDSLQQAATNAQDRVQAKAGELGDAAREQLSQMEDWLRRATGGAPLALGALALAAGVILGFTLPATPQERELLAEVRETMTRQGREIAQDAQERAQRVALEARDAAARAARDQGLIH